MQPGSVILFRVSFSGPDVLSRYDGSDWADLRMEVGIIGASLRYALVYSRPTEELQRQLPVSGYILQRPCIGPKPALFYDVYFVFAMNQPM